MKTVLALTGPSGSGKSTLAARLSEVYGFDAIEGSNVISQHARLRGSPAPSTREQYEDFFRAEQHRAGMAWIAGELLRRTSNRLAYAGLRSKYDFARIHSAGGFIIALDCDPKTCLARSDPSDPKNPTTTEEYERHAQLQNSPDEYGSHLDWVIAHADRHIDTSLAIPEVNAQLDTIVGELLV
ncbi:MAG TPA: AAA family ATPase [Candidatus Saccharimonadales bacterium]